ncbi:unnamed protein product [Rotaria magnacalcarata]|uniref:Uncharacterized protein n=1 Tax=Rotaria magnacalcarata TaxID=392030 RepID=A0A816S2S0_9BILA|nr:unnamed protein product [Rotaria magnacalcarata]
MATFCREKYKGNSNEIKLINKLECTYEKSKVIYWYTCECFTYKMLNAASRTLDFNVLIKMDFFLRDLHHQIEELYQQQMSDFDGKPLYRGQGLSKDDFAKLTATKSGFISFNNFLSISREITESIEFAKNALEKKT